MAVNLRISEYQTWGRYLSLYTVYRIDVKYKDDEWFIFRRFSEFTGMHDLVRAIILCCMCSVYITVTYLLVLSYHYFYGALTEILKDVLTI